MIAFTSPSTTAMIRSGIGPEADTPGTTCVATHTAIATTTVWIEEAAALLSFSHEASVDPLRDCAWI